LFYRFYKEGDPCSFHPWQFAAVAGMLCHAIMSQVPARLKEYASNHADKQIQYVPLQSIGHECADKKVRRAGIVEKLDGPMLPIHRVSELKFGCLRKI